MIDYRIETKIYNRNVQGLNTNERKSNTNIKISNNATFDMPYSVPVILLTNWLL